MFDDISQLSLEEESQKLEFELIDLKQLVSLTIVTLNQSQSAKRIFDISSAEDDHYIWGDRQLTEPANNQNLAQFDNLFE